MRGICEWGTPYTRTSLYKLLTEVAYACNVRYRDEVHSGEHPAIVEPDLWQRVEAFLGWTVGAPVRSGEQAFIPKS